MNLKQLLAVTFCLVFIQGCSIFENGYSSSYSPDTNYSYDDDSNATNESSYQRSGPRRRKAELDNEMPVQMTKQDSKLESLSPEIKQPTTSKSNNKLLLPISGNLE